MRKKVTKVEVMEQIKYGTRYPWKTFLRVIKRGAHTKGYIKDKKIYLALLGTTLDVSLIIDILLLIIPEYSIISFICKVLFSYIFSLMMIIFCVIVGEEIYLIYKMIDRLKK